MIVDDNSGYVGRNRTGGQLVVESLIGEGVNTVFGIPGSHVLAIYDALRDTPQIRHVGVGHENNAALMAEAYARLSGKPGVVLVTAGPGATNAVSGIAQAYTSASPVVIITGSVPVNAKKEVFHGVDDPTFLHRIFSAVAKLSVRIERPEDIPKVLASAFSCALSGRPGPVHVEIGEAVLKAKVENAPQYHAMQWKKLELDTSTIDRIFESLRHARRPVIVAGKGVLVSRAKAELAQVAEILAAPVTFPHDALGAMSYRHRWCAGAVGTFMGLNPFNAKLLREADVLLGIGLRPVAANLDPITANAPRNFVFIGFNNEPVVQDGATVSCVADPKIALQALIDRLEPFRRTADAVLLEEIEANKRAMLQAIRAAIDPYRARTPLHFGLVMEELAKHLTPDTVVVGDVGNHTAWAMAYLVPLGADDFFAVGPWGAMGFAIPGSIGAKIACPNRRVVGLTGDGSFLMSSADFATAARNRLNIVYVVLKDSRHGMVDRLQRRDYGRTYATEITPPDFVKYAGSFGALGIQVRRVSDMGEAFQRAFRAEGPVLVEVIGDHAVPYVSAADATGTRR